MEKCQKCPVGTFTNSIATKTCTAAPPGGFVNETGRIWYHLCPPNKYSSKAKSVKCTKCKDRTFSRTYGSSSCEPLPPGFMLRNITRPSILVDIHEALPKNDSTEEILKYALSETLVFLRIEPHEESEIVHRQVMVESTRSANATVTRRQIAISPRNDSEVALNRVQETLIKTHFRDVFLAKAVSVGWDTLRLRNLSNDCHLLNNHSFQVQILPPFSIRESSNGPNHPHFSNFVSSYPVPLYSRNVFE